MQSTNAIRCMAHHLRSNRHAVFSGGALRSIAASTSQRKKVVRKMNNICQMWLWWCSIHTTLAAGGPAPREDTSLHNKKMDRLQFPPFPCDHEPCSPRTHKARGGRCINRLRGKKNHGTMNRDTLDALGTEDECKRSTRDPNRIRAELDSTKL